MAMPQAQLGWFTFFALQHAASPSHHGQWPSVSCTTPIDSFPLYRKKELGHQMHGSSYCSEKARISPFVHHTEIFNWRNINHFDIFFPSFVIFEAALCADPVHYAPFFQNRTFIRTEHWALKWPSWAHTRYKYKVKNGSFILQHSFSLIKQV